MFRGRIPQSTMEDRLGELDALGLAGDGPIPG
jgi:hypothetical protein